MKNELPLISIIVPVYNVEKYLPRCINSLVCQTYENIEIILVDDGSTDRCGEICEEYSQKDGRIKVVHKQNGGLSDARNVGLDIAKGDYFLFVDSDDWIESETCKVTVNIAIENQADIVPFGVTEVFDDGSVIPRPIRLKDCASPEECIKALIYRIPQYGLCNYVWNKLCSKKLYDGIRFYKGRVAEDQGITYKLFHRAKKIAICKQSLYNYYQREGSISKRKYEHSQSVDRISFWLERFEFVKKYYPQLRDYQLAQILGDIYISLVLMNNEKKYSDFKNSISEFAAQYSKEERKLSKYNKKIWLHYYCYPLFWIYVKLFLK